MWVRSGHVVIVRLLLSLVVCCHGSAESWTEPCCGIIDKRLTTADACSPSASRCRCCVLINVLNQRFFNMPIVQKDEIRQSCSVLEPGPVVQYKCHLKLVKIYKK